MRSKGITNAPDFPSGLEWLNCDSPVRLGDLRGKLVILDFWTHCCINCQHILPNLRQIEERYAPAVAVIGIHSAKFKAERSLVAVRDAVRRHGVRHPVVNDAKREIWRQYAVRAWPTLFFIDPTGKMIARHEGEFALQGMLDLIATMLDEFENQGLLNHQPLPYAGAEFTADRKRLRYPGKLLATAEKLYIADSGNSRIVVTNKTGTVESTVAGFINPQGMALYESSLLVADAGDHTIRRLDLQTGKVKLLAGTGQCGYSSGVGLSPAQHTKLSSPMDIAVIRNTAYIAMAGVHQLWQLRLDSGEIGVWAGSGQEGIGDGPLAEATLAQPMGCAAHFGSLFFVDSETSSLRVAGAGRNGRVVTLVGSGLFSFGDRDGYGKAARLQHPQAVAYGGDKLYVADTYNSVIKLVAIETLKVSTLVGKQGGLNQPAGIACTDDQLFVADTNNHAVRVFDRHNGSPMPFEMRGL